MSPFMTKKKKTAPAGPTVGSSQSTFPAPLPPPKDPNAPDPGQSEPGAEPEEKPEEEKGGGSGSTPGGFGFGSGSSGSKLNSRVADSMSASAGPRAAQVEERLDDGQALLNPGASTGIQGAPVSRAAAPGIDMDSDVTARVIKLLQGV